MGDYKSIQKLLSSMGSLADVKVTRFVNEVEAGFTALQVNTLVTKIYDKFEVE